MMGVVEDIDGFGVGLSTEEGKGEAGDGDGRETLDG